MNQGPSRPPSIFSFATKATETFEQELGRFLEKVRERWSSTPEEDRDRFLRSASDELMTRFHEELAELARLKLSSLPAREHYPVSEGSFVNGFYMKMIQDPAQLLGVDVGDGSRDVHRRVFLGGFYRAMGRAVVDRGRRERVAARAGREGKRPPVLRDLACDVNQLELEAQQPEARDAEFMEERELLFRRLEATHPRQAEIARMKILGDPMAPLDAPEFRSMPEERIAATLGVSLRLVQKEWRAAKQWLASELEARGHLARRVRAEPPR